MSLFCVSLPGRFGDWCDGAIARLASSVLGPVISTGGSTPEQLAAELIDSEGQHFYVGARNPSRWLREKLIERSKKIVVALDDPQHAVSDLTNRHQIGLFDAARQVASSCAAISQYVTLPGALVVNAERDWANPAETLMAFARHFGLLVDRAEADTIVEELNAAGLGLDPQEPTVQWQDNELVMGAIGSYAEYFVGGTLGTLRWERELFFEEHHKPPAHPIEITGKVRYLIYGPYITLPPAGWTAEMILGFSEDATETSFRIEVWAGSMLGSATIQPPRAGVFPVDVSFVIEEGNDNLVEIRVRNERSAIFGRLALGHVILTPRSGVSQLTAANLRLELGLGSDGRPLPAETATEPAVATPGADVSG